MQTMNGVTSSRSVSGPAMADVPEPGRGNKQTNKKNHCCPIETAVNQGVILSAISVSLFEQTYQGTKQKGRGKSNEMSSSANPWGTSCTCDATGIVLPEKGLLTARMIFKRSTFEYEFQAYIMSTLPIEKTIC